MPLLPITRPQPIANRRADAKPPAQLAAVHPILLEQHHKLMPLRHDRLLRPRHPKPLPNRPKMPIGFVNHVSEHPSTISPVYTPQKRGEGLCSWTSAPRPPVGEGTERSEARVPRYQVLDLYH